MLYIRDDLSWTVACEERVDRDLDEISAKETYADRMEFDEVTQLIKVGSETVMFTGFIEEEVVVVQFERGILPALPSVVGGFREYMIEHDIDFTALNVAPNSA